MKTPTPIGGEFARIIRRDPNKLEGSVISFSRMKDKELVGAGVPRIFAAYATINLEKYIARVADSREVAEYIRNMAKDIGQQVKEKCGERSMTRIYSSQLTLNDETKLYRGKEDIVLVGEYSNPFCCTESVNFGIQLYFFKYDEQNPNSSKIRLENKTSGMSPLKAELLRNFIFPLIDSYKHNDPTSAKTIGENLIQTYGNSSIANPLMDILKIVNQQKIKPNMQAIHLNLDEAQAINDERFEDAARIRDEIKRLGGLL